MMIIDTGAKKSIMDAKCSSLREGARKRGFGHTVKHSKARFKGFDGSRADSKGMAVIEIPGQKTLEIELVQGQGGATVASLLGQPAIEELGLTIDHAAARYDAETGIWRPQFSKT